jgi:hypothetical protein
VYHILKDIYFNNFLERFVAINYKPIFS